MEVYQPRQGQMVFSGEPCTIVFVDFANADEFDRVNLWLRTHGGDAVTLHLNAGESDQMGSKDGEWHYMLRIEWECDETLAKFLAAFPPDLDQ